jgi:hypothetical protein
MTSLSGRVKTAALAREIGVSYPRLYQAMYRGCISTPERDSSGDYLWSPMHVSEARQYFRQRIATRKAAISAGQ